MITTGGGWAPLTATALCTPAARGSELVTARDALPHTAALTAATSLSNTPFMRIEGFTSNLNHSWDYFARFAFSTPRTEVTLHENVFVKKAAGSECDYLYSAHNLLQILGGRQA